jgi:hypothetical protein
MIADVLDELRRRWPYYVVETFQHSRSFAIKQHNGNVMATVAIITEFRE